MSDLRRVSELGCAVCQRHLRRSLLLAGLGFGAILLLASAVPGTFMAGRAVSEYEIVFHYLRDPSKARAQPQRNNWVAGFVSGR
jgi:hypothetical protein